MYKNLFFSIVAIIALTGFICIPNSPDMAPIFKRLTHQTAINSASGFVPVSTLSANKKPSNLWCYCADGSVYSYGNGCMIGWVGCEKNDCPAQPPGCNGQ